MYMIKYYLINSNSRGSQYGVGTYIRQMTEGLRVTGRYDISYINLHCNEQEFTITHDRNGCTIYNIPAVDCDYEQYCRKAIYLLMLYIPVEEHIVFHFNFIHHDCMANMLRANYANCRIIATVHYLSWCFALNGNYKDFKSVIRTYGQKSRKDDEVYSSFLAEQNFFRTCDEIIVLSEYTRDILVNDYKLSADKLHLVYNGLKGKAQEHNTETSKYILFVGRLDEIKGVEYLIRAFEKIADKHPDYALYLVGDGNYSKYMSLCESLRDRVVFTGKVNSTQLKQLYNNAAIGVLPSFHEQCSYSAIEMLRYGIPLIITDSTGLKETLQEVPENIIHIPTGKLRKDEFVQSLENKMDWLLSNVDLRKKQSQQMCEIFAKRYTRSRMIHGFTSVVEQSFDRERYVVPTDIYPSFDRKMYGFINQRPELDMEYYGLSGIGVYLWYRICQLRDKKDIDSRLKFGELSEYMIYYLDWLWHYVQTEYSDGMTVCDELQYALHDMNKCGFFKTRVQKLIATLGIEKSMPCAYNADNVMHNTIKICNCKI